MKKIVLGYDDTAASQHALERAADFVQAFGAALVVTSVSPVVAGGPHSVSPLDLTDDPAKHTQELAGAREFLSARGIEAEYQPAIGSPADTIVQVAETQAADMIVVGTREPNVVGRLLGHSVSTSVSHKAHCDVLIVH